MWHYWFGLGSLTVGRDWVSMHLSGCLQWQASDNPSLTNRIIQMFVCIVRQAVLYSCKKVNDEQLN